VREERMITELRDFSTGRRLPLIDNKATVDRVIFLARQSTCTNGRYRAKLQLASDAGVAEPSPRHWHMNKALAYE
jgi:hypothetical protein